MPCVIQARLNGIKGVFVLAPDLNDRDILIQYRPSQHKFNTSHNILEIIKHSSSGKLSFKKQNFYQKFTLYRNGFLESTSNSIT